MGPLSHSSQTAPKNESERVAFTGKRERYWDEFARRKGWRLGGYYHGRLASLYGSLIPAGSRVLELGSGSGDLLSALRPALGVGVDFSEATIEKARARHPDLTFVRADVHDLDLRQQFDYIICADFVNELWDVQRVFEVAHKHSHAGTRIIINTYSRLWEIPRRVLEASGLVSSQLEQNWLTREDVSNLLYLAGFESIRHWQEILWPFPPPGLNGLANRFLVKMAPFRWLGLTNFIIARPQPRRRDSAPPLVSVVVPARNEAGNIRAIFQRVPCMGAGTELIFVEGHSTDSTFGAIQQAISEHPDIPAKLLKQTGTGKGDAVRTGFANASGDLLMILDADLTVAPEDLPRFYEAWISGKGDLVNGVRLVYPVGERAMRFLNLLGNKFFSLAFTWLLGQNVKDTLCGTKVVSKGHYEMIAANRGYFGEQDPFGDFDLLFGAARFGLKIVDLPVRYHERTYGRTNIHRWRHGWLLLRMVFLAMRRIKFV